MMKKFIVLTIIILPLIFSACGGGYEPYEPLEFLPAEEEPDYAEAPEYEAEPFFVPAGVLADDGVLRLHMRPPATLNPLANTDPTVARILRLVFEPLAMLDDELRVVGFLADLEFASDFGSVNATIREGALWSDGLPVTADDVVFSLEFLRNAPSGAVYRHLVDEIYSAERIDARTVQIIFSRASVLAAYSLNFPIIPRHLYDEANPVGSGPFAVEAVSQWSLSLSRNPHARERAAIESAEITFLPDLETDFYAFERGRIDALHLPLPEWTRHHGVRSPIYETFPAMYFEFIGFNFSREIFRDSNTRLAIAHAFDADSAVAGLFLGYAARAATPIHPQNWAADASVTGAVYDPARAAALLGTVQTPAPLVILANENNPQRVRIATLLAESLTRAGLESHAKIVPADEYFEKIAAGEFDLFIGGMELSFAPDVRVFFQAGGLFPHDAALESAFTALLFASTEAAYVQAMSRLQTAFVEQMPVIGLTFRHSALLSSPRITSALNPAPDFVFAGAREWTMR